ncbi:MAG: plasmid stabilization system [Bacteroidota bacterium]
MPPAREEFRMAREWYRQQLVKGLSDRFAKSVKDTVARIQFNPYAFAVRYKNVRIAHTNIFPYALHFYLDNDTIIITSIIFQGRNPLIARSRVE